MRRPPLTLQATTLWDYPSQHYGAGMQGDRDYAGATPSYAIWNLLQRYTREGDLVVDPFCGSGTTLDVARDLNRKARGFDVHPYREDIEHADARDLPLPDAVADFVFADPPYSDNLNYGDDPRCIGKLNATDQAYFDALDQALQEAWRVLKDRRYIAIYICDYYSKKRGFVPIGAHVMGLMMQYFRPIDHVCIVRHNKALKMGNRRRAAEEGNFFLRGFNHLLIGKKERT
ncbi:DNA methylase [Myxococcota bacterium]|nr:DNA methylase [Myxococcota bacterium]MBU1433247.1 DNA methylase [Myxococcota bacterium]MBU1896897.1 DNA methylase [Myxococcota bacterium]